MDLLYFVKERLRFVRTFYETAQKPFVEIQQSIDDEEEPYVDHRNPEYADEPAFLAEWMDAELAIDVVGMASIGMLKAALHSFLRETVKALAGDQGLARVSDQRKGNWLKNYEALFASELGIDWGTSAADLALLEQLVLTRNDFEHEFGILRGFVHQSKGHAKQYPTSKFHAKGFEAMKRLVVEKNAFGAVCDAVEELCEFLSGSRAQRSR